MICELRGEIFIRSYQNGMKKEYFNFLRFTMLFGYVLIMTNLSSGQTKWNLENDGCGGVRWSKGLYGNYDEEAFDLISREISLSEIPKELKIEGSRHGGVLVNVWDKNEIRIKACIQARGRTEEEAKKIAATVSVLTGGGTIKADSPYSSAEDVPYGVNYDIKIPKNLNLKITTVNGGINISGTESVVDFSIENGGAVLNNLAGDVSGKIDNGSMTIRLAGKQWNGGGLDAQIGNGNISLLIPKDYSARLETGTRWGSLVSEIGDVKQSVKNNNLSFDIGNGGATLKVLTGSGNIQIRQ